MKTLKELELKSKRVLMRVDFNVPLDDNGEITDDSRIRAALPSIEYVLGKNGRLILMSHLGRPRGKVKEELRLTPCARRLSELLKRPVRKADDCIGDEVVKAALGLKDGEVLLLENLRFHNEETKNDPEFAKKLAALGEVYVNDAFGTSHRAHASVAGVVQYIPAAAAGFLVEKEIKYLKGVLTSDQHPVAAILGGAKVSDKIPVIENLLARVDKILVGGAMAYTLLKSQGVAVGASLVEDDKLEVAGDILEKARERGVAIILPEDHRLRDGSTVEDIPEGGVAYDIGAKSIERFKKELKDARTIIWNGPLGKFEDKAFRQGTWEIARFLSELSAITIIGGGDSAAAVKAAGVAEKMTHISTGGGASLEYLEGKVLPGIAALEK